MYNVEKLFKNNHDNNLLSKSDTNKRNCNCRTNNTCPLDGKCLASNIVYSAEALIVNNQHRDKYFGICETEFKTRLSNHKNSFKNRQKEKDTQLFKYIWNLKDKNITDYSIKWFIVKQSSGHNSTNVWIYFLNDGMEISLS